MLFNNTNLTPDPSTEGTYSSYNPPAYDLFQDVLVSLFSAFLSSNQGFHKVMFKFVAL